MKDALTSFDVRALARELAPLVGSHADKVYQRGREEVTLRLRQPGEGRVDLVVGPGRFAYLTRKPRPYPEEPPPFAQQLRKHVTGTRLAAVRQVGFDRVLELTLARRDESFLLVLEFFHEGNVILVRDGRILACLTTQVFAHRTVRAGHEFKEPPERLDPTALDAPAFAARMRAGAADAVRTLAVELGLGGQYAEEVCTRADVAKDRPASLLKDDEARALYAAFRSLVDAVDEGRAEPVVVRGAAEDAPAVDAAPFPLRSFDPSTTERVEALSVALERVFERAVEERDDRIAKYLEEKGRLERQLATQRQALARFGREEEESKRAGDAIYANYAVVDEALSRVRETVKGPGWDALKEEVRRASEAGSMWAKAIASLDPGNGRIVVRIPAPDASPKPLMIGLGVTMDLPANAAAHYEKGKKVRDKAPGAEEALRKTEARLAELEAKGARLLERADIAEKAESSSRRFWFETYRWFLARTGNLVLAGRDARSNDRLVKRHLEASDRYAHADVHGAPSVVVKGDPDITEETMAEACAFAAAYSRAWSSGVASAEAYWVMPSQVSKTPEAGEYLATGAFIIRGKRNHVSSGLRVAVGAVTIEGARKVMGGPVASVEARSDAYIVLVPGDEDANLLARRLARALRARVEEVQAVLPPGPCRVVSVHGLDLAEVDAA